jgi:hypothetical protein
MTNEVVLSAVQRQRIDNGAALLDSKTGFDWAKRVNCASLDINSIHSCVLTQVFGGYYAGRRRLELSHEVAKEYGFWPADDDTMEWNAAQKLSAAKTDYWRELILKRQTTIKGEVKS